MIGRTIAHYKVTAKLGAGGMGEVYRATDSKLGRDVALKVLPPDMARDSERLARFQREARAVAALNHPHIVTVFSVEEAGGVHFLTMELVEGQSLDRRIPEGGLPVEQIVEFASALAEALAAAHEKGIVHRDLKPANVMVTDDGRVKVLDFGLAKDVRADKSNDATLTADGDTKAGVVMGTPVYMSPEQVAGRAVDHRTDIFSLGILLYEMATGRRPFAGASSAELASAILRDSPPIVTDLRTDLPGDLARIIRRCLEKDPRHRLQTARDVANEFRDLARQASQTAVVIAPARSPARPSASDASGAARADEGFWVAVLPFKSSGDGEMESFADGLGEEITTGLSRFRYLSVVASASAARLKGETGDERALGAKLGARYVLEGSIRKGGPAIRVSAQLIDAQTGAQLWAETYNRDLQTSSIFAVQDDVAARMVATVADSYGVLVHSIGSAIRQKDDVDLTPVEWQFQYFAYREQITPAAHAAFKSRLERVLERDNRQSDLWACLAQIYVDEHAFGFRGDATSLHRALAAARRAVEFDRANQFALVSLAQVHFFRRDLAAFGPAAERAMALNPLNTDALGILGLQIVHTGEFERGTAIVRRAMELNANHAGWMHFAPLWQHFHKGEYEQALECANRVDVPGLFWPYLVVAAACGHLGRRAEAQAAVRDLLALDPEFAAHARSNIESWHFASGLLEPVLEGLRKAGLSIPATDGSSDPPRRNGTVTAKADRAESGADSGQVRADEGFWVAVLPFKYSGNNAELTALAEGLTEEIVTGLSRFSYLRVIARGSTAKLRGEAVDVRFAGKELGARYVMEGSLRQAGTRLRIAGQLVDAVSGAHLWAETYDRAFSPEAVFELQDDLVPKIVSTVADMHGVLPRTMSESLRFRAPDSLSPYEAVLRSFAYFEHVTEEEMAAARAGLEAAVAKAPSYADAWALLALLCVQDYAQGFELQADSLAIGAHAARRAVELAPSNHLAYFSLAQAFFFQKEVQSFRNAADRTLALNPMDGNSIAFLGEMLAYSGDWERGLALAQRARQLNPHHPGWYWHVDFNNAYRQRDYRGAYNFGLKMNLAQNWGGHALMAAACGQLGEKDAAARSMRELLRIRPDFAARIWRDRKKWFDDEHGAHLLEGLRKAGLEIASEQVVATALPSADTASRPEGIAVVVLPFANRSPDAGNEYFSDGLTEEIISNLSRIEALKVISRNSSMALKGATRDTPSLAKQLGVTHVVSGSVRKAGEALRVTAELVEAVRDTSVWSETFAGTLADVFGMQEEIARKIVAALQVQLTDTGERRAANRPIEDVAAYDYYLRARQELYGWTLEAQDRAARMVDQALGIVGDNPLLLATKGQISWNKVNVMLGGDARNLEEAADCARRALAVDPQDYLGLFLRGLVEGLRGETARALHDMHRAHQLRPQDPNVLTEMCRFASASGVEVTHCVAEAVKIDPLTPVTWLVVSTEHFVNGRMDQVVAPAHRAIELANRVSMLQLFAAWQIAAAGQRAVATDVLEKAAQGLTWPLHRSWALLMRYAFEGDAERCRSQMTPQLEQAAGMTDFVALSIADSYSLIGQVDESLKWLRICTNRGFINYPFLAEFDPLLASVRSDPRFSLLMREVKARWESLAQNLPPPLRALPLPGASSPPQPRT